MSEEKTAFGGETAYVLRDQTGAEARIVPAIGANCIAFRTRVAGQDAHLISTPSSLEVLRTRPTFWGFPILAPYPGRHQTPFTWRGRSYSITANDRPGVALHGIVAGSAWEVVQATESSLTCRFDSETYLGRPERWPWPFSLTATHSVQDGMLRLDLELENRADEEIPHLLGLHPYFPLTFALSTPASSQTSNPPTAAELAGAGAAQARDTCEVWVAADELWEMRAGLGTGTIDRLEGAHDLRRPKSVAYLEREIGRPSGEGQFGNDQNVAGPRLPVLLYGKKEGLRVPQSGVDPAEPGGVTSGIRDRRSGIEAVLESSAGFGSLAVFFPPEQPFISLEPRSAVSDALTLMNDPRHLSTGVHPLAPGERWKAWASLSARPIKG
jgi:galactose mutarotase-like enzyme